VEETLLLNSLSQETVNVHHCNSAAKNKSWSRYKKIEFVGFDTKMG
jgi:hypothetical protein